MEHVVGDGQDAGGSAQTRRLLSRESSSASGESAGLCGACRPSGTQPATIKSKQGTRRQCTSQYRYFSKPFAEEAQEAENQAAQHDHLAQQLSTETVQK
jgi:hypothetical protein